MLHLSEHELVTIVQDESHLSQRGCWWGISAKDDTNELEISIRAMTPNGGFAVSSSPTSLSVLTQSGLSKALKWWKAAHRQAVQHFWGPQDSSVPIFVILSLSKAQRFISGTTTNSLEIGKETRIVLNGHVNQETGKLYFAENSPWRFEVNDLNLRYHESDNFEARAMATRMFRVQGESVGYQMVQRVWEFFLPWSL